MSKYSDISETVRPSNVIVYSSPYIGISITAVIYHSILGDKVILVGPLQTISVDEIPV